jgi:hypothetical protein
MATYQEIHSQVQTLTPDEQLCLLEELAGMVRRRMMLKPSFAELVTVPEDKGLKEMEKPVKRRFPPSSIAGKGKTLGDIVSPIVDEEDWECLMPQ